MQVSNMIYIVMPIVAVLCLAILIGMPYIGARLSRGSRSGAATSVAVVPPSPSPSPRPQIRVDPVR